MIPQNNICRFDLGFRKRLCFKVIKIWEYSKHLKYCLEYSCEPCLINLLINEMIDILSSIDDGSYWKVKKD
jgi:hypothetical protein